MNNNIRIVATTEAPQPTFPDEVKQTLSRLFFARVECFNAMEKLEELGVLAVSDEGGAIDTFFESIDWCCPAWLEGEIPTNQETAEFFTYAITNSYGGIRKIGGRHLSAV